MEMLLLSATVRENQALAFAIGLKNKVFAIHFIATYAYSTGATPQFSP
jgi:hypothetical protein